MRWVRLLNEGETAASLVGGKARGLMSLTAAGFCVPPGFVVTAEAYRGFVEGLGLESSLRELPTGSPDGLEGPCARLRARVTTAPWPEEMSAEVAAALDRLGDGPVAVRSSSTFEDLAQAAFAGQHDTFLDVRGLAAVLDAVRACFASLWQPRAVAYRHGRGFTQSDAQMAVVVQQMVPSEVAGVGFTIEPVTGALDRLTVDARLGSGEAVVSGEHLVDHFELRRDTLDVTAVRSEGAPCLDAARLRELGRLLLAIEDHAGWPQDVEWALAGGRFHVLQARPVTRLPARWTRDESAERFPNPISPLAWDFMRLTFDRSLAHSLALMGLPPFAQNWFERFNDHVYGNQSAVTLLSRYRPFRARTAEELEREVPSLARRFAWVGELPVAWARDLDRYLIGLGRLSAADLRSMTEAQLLGHLEAIAQLTGEYFRPNIAISMTQALLHGALHAVSAMVLGPAAALPAVDALLAGIETKTSQVNAELAELALLAAEVPGFTARLLAEGGRVVWDGGLAAAHPAFAARFDAFLADHGHRELDMDAMQPTWADAPWIVLDTVALVLRSGPRSDPADAGRSQKNRSFEAEDRLLAAAPQGLRLFCRELVRLARLYTALDDLEHYQTTRVNPLARRAALELGNRLVSRGFLEVPGDVFFFRKEELHVCVERIAAGAADHHIAAVRARVQAAKDSYEVSRQRTPPWSPDQPPPPPVTGRILRGIPGSPGRMTARCCLVRDPSDFARFRSGAVLVARTTNPAWTPLFFSAAALVTEAGGPLSHGAVTAREMGLPAVLSARGALDVLVDGQLVTVDGSLGTVELGEPAERS